MAFAIRLKTERIQRSNDENSAFKRTGFRLHRFLIAWRGDSLRRVASEHLQISFKITKYLFLQNPPSPLLKGAPPLPIVPPLREKTNRPFFQIPSPLCLKGVHLFLPSLPSGKGQVDSEGRPSASRCWYGSQAFAPTGFAVGFYRLAG